MGILWIPILKNDVIPFRDRSMILLPDYPMKLFPDSFGYPDPEIPISSYGHTSIIKGCGGILARLEHCGSAFLINLKGHLFAFIGRNMAFLKPERLSLVLVK